MQAGKASEHNPRKDATTEANALLLSQSRKTAVMRAGPFRNDPIRFNSIQYGILSVQFTSALFICHVTHRPLT